MSITILDSKEICLDEPFELSVRPETFQKADSGTASEIKIVRVWSMAGEDGSHSVDNSHQYPNVMEQISPIIQADNLGSKSVSNPSKKTTDNKASRLERRRKYQRELRKDPAFAERERRYHREYKRERRKDPAFAEREREYQREYQRERRKDPAFAERKREYQRERRKDPAFAEREREYHREYQRERRKDPSFAKYRREYQRERCKDPVFAQGQRIYMSAYNRIKKQTANKEEASKQAKIAREQYLQSIHSAGNSGELTLTSNSDETNQSPSKNSDGTLPANFQCSS
ncbi:hypothetical protein J7438_24875 [Thalassotalea sp. G20_0]|uniref:hypothetical protein n=1 Tax=Thalassotalea sp. G20_0 TaxID=2821093 RepID=UPI001ADD4CB5|nr:hypothetical protein [Thalassotalea sp. G20_0]MBO9497292.1 hypothetical protein [Thalassotalea sp. G20_0]